MARPIRNELKLYSVKTDYISAVSRLATRVNNRATMAPMAVDHYENFPVASVLLPRHLRVAVADIYRFARTADDIADEGDAPPSERLAQLHAYQAGLDAIAAGMPLPAEAPAAVFEPLALTLARHDLPIAPLHRLLLAFIQDVTQTRYPDAHAVLDYCTRSANPVGELMLHLYGHATPQNVAASDAICTGLQLTNFCQDVAIDLDKPRLYLPEDEIRAAGLNPDAVAAAQGSPAWRALMRQQVGRARAQLLTGAPLALRVPGRIGWELRLVVCGGLRILDRLDAADYDVFHARPTLGRRDWLAIARRAMTYRRAVRAQPALP